MQQKKGNGDWVTNFLHWRGMTWVLLLWGAYVATWMMVTDSGLTLAAVWWLAGMVGLTVLRPTYRMVLTGRPSPPTACPGDAGELLAADSMPPTDDWPSR